MRGEWQMGKPFHWEYITDVKKGKELSKRKFTRSFRTKSEAIKYGKTMRNKWVQADLMDWSNMINMKKVGGIDTKKRYRKGFF